MKNFRRLVGGNFGFFEMLGVKLRVLYMILYNIYLMIGMF